MKKLLCSSLFILAVFAPFSVADEAVNENELFSDPDSISQAPVNKDKQIAIGDEKKSISFSGELTNANIDVFSSTSSYNNLNTYTVANLFLDVRMKKGIKAFANMEANVKSKETTYDLRELFFDFNYGNKVYFRTGKQVLQWGRCNLWNPTDLVNVEKQVFIRKIGYREGTYGLKMHIPFGTKYNIYGFLDTSNAAGSEDAAGALKFEFVAGKTEMAFSAWGKSGYNPVMGYDLSTRVAKIDIAAEVSASKGDNFNKLEERGGLLYLTKDDSAVSPQAAITMTKYFDLGNFNDRVSLTSEFFYNGAGYEQNLFADKTLYPFASPVMVNNLAVLAGTKSNFMLYNNLYTPNYYSKYYGALFLSVTRFIVTDMTFSSNYIRNLNDGSGIISTGLTYTTLYDFTAGLLVNSTIGEPDREYTLSNMKYDIELTLGISF